MDTISSSGYRSEAGQQVGSIGKRVISLLPRNPADKTTIVSIYPREIVDVKPTLFPSRFVVPAALIGDFSLLVIEGASYFIPSMIEKQPPTEVQVNSLALAESILHDSIPSMNLVTSESRPGVFCINGEWTRKNIKDYKHADGRSFDELITLARQWQQNYWTSVIDEADFFWSQGANPKVIPDDAKLAAKILNLEKVKPWMNNVVASELVPCIACGAMKNPVYPICQVCKTVNDPDKVKALGLVFADK